MIMGSMPFTAYVAEAEALRRLGNERIWLDDDLDATAYPWVLVTECQQSGVVRCQIEVDVRLTAIHPCGLTFIWSVHIEPRRAGGSPDPMVDLATCRRVAGLLPEGPRGQFLDHLANCAVKMRESAAEHRQVADRRSAAADEIDTIRQQIAREVTS